MGDGLLAEFPSVVEAVECAIEVQQDPCWTANQTFPMSGASTLRIGINLGDVMVEGSDLYGDSVNVAARLEALAEPGWRSASPARPSTWSTANWVSRLKTPASSN